MPLKVADLMSSDAWLMATGDQAKARITLWCRAWHQVPAGSLPNNDKLLAKLSGDETNWARLKLGAARFCAVFGWPTLSRETVRTGHGVVRAEAQKIRRRQKGRP